MQVFSHKKVICQPSIKLLCFISQVENCVYHNGIQPRIIVGFGIPLYVSFPEPYCFEGWKLLTLIFSQCETRSVYCLCHIPMSFIVCDVNSANWCPNYGPWRLRFPWKIESRCYIYTIWHNRFTQSSIRDRIISL